MVNQGAALSERASSTWVPQGVGASFMNEVPLSARELPVIERERFLRQTISMFWEERGDWSNLRMHSRAASE